MQTLRAVLARPRVRLGAALAVVLFAPASSQTQVRGCPRFARVPGYGACTNISGNACGFCTYRCNDETVVRWNVCKA